MKPKKTLEIVREKTSKMRQKLAINQVLLDELSLSRPKRKHPLLSFTNDLVKRPPNREQMRQVYEVLLEQRRVNANLLFLVEKWLEQNYE